MSAVAPEAKTEAKPDPKVKDSGKKSGGSKRGDGKKTTTTRKAEATTAKQQPAAKTEAKAKQPRERKLRPGQATKRPADLAKAQQQPAKGTAVTDAMIDRAREQWGITPHAKAADTEAIRPGQRGWIVHLRVKGDKERTLCGTRIMWSGGAKVVEDTKDADMCLWCLARVTERGKKTLAA